MLPIVLIAAAFLFPRERRKNVVRLLLFLIFLTGIYFLLRISFLGGLAGMEAQHGYYSFSNIPTLFIRFFEILGSVLFSPFKSYYPAENIIALIVRVSFIISMTIILSGLFIKRKYSNYINENKMIIFGFSWIILFSVPILFPFELIRLGYILVPGAAFIIAGGISIFETALLKKSKVFYLVLILLVLVLAQQTVTQLRVGYENYGEGSFFNDAKNQSLYKVWNTNLPEDVKKRWHEEIMQNR